MTERMGRAALEQQIMDRAARDPAFRASLVNDPRGTVAREFGIAVPERFQMTVVEETPNAVYLVFPPASSDLELSDDELEAVAGGSGYTTTCGGCPP